MNIEEIDSGAVCPDDMNCPDVEEQKTRLEEGDDCHCENCSGKMGFEEVIGCYCHIAPPCSACVDNPLVCLECGFEEE